MRLFSTNRECTRCIAKTFTPAGKRHGAARPLSAITVRSNSIGNPESLNVYLHHENRVETHTFEGDNHHGGGDAVLAKNFVEVIRGEAESVSPLENGLRNTLQCLKAKESAASGCFEQIEWDA